ncbi:NADH dehydrogenase [ubiquinone] 1 beta subcomplex subunit 11, mitochondrial isoform X2 [Rhineura floridana]|uniref:NADH dehydrogenase [ubiquinone] 1 beta subcomplex subunit 11, mitochondrial isoform X2 n=1 Tax=Rhineura floridana TaxID=261503 RepID=UPI002AC8243B|nr:NADH dehydrogenase [ubiquinone] 1 beta subcomplex subunit 11, mitochondrial isoform X2 [Rhineura floridana]
MAALRRIAGVQRLLGLPALAARAVSSGGASSSSASVQVPPAPSSALVVPGHSEEEVEVSVFAKNPDYHGFDADPVVDLWNMRLAFFFGVSITIILGSTFLHYLPDHGGLSHRSSIASGKGTDSKYMDEG